MKKQILKVMLILSMVVLILVPLSANAASSGTCGATVKWTLADNGTLTISGTGDMSSFYESTLPWKDLRDNIKSVVIGEGVTRVGGTSFLNCTNLASVSLPQSLKEIGNHAFNGCTALRSITLPSALTTIGSNAFAECSGLTSITIPQNVASIGSWAFHNCSNLSSITWNAKNVADFDTAGVFVNAGSNTSGITVTFANGVERIPAYAFRSCSKVTTVTVPDSVTYIGEYAFDETTYYKNAWQNNGLYIGTRLVKVKDPSSTSNGKFEVKSGTKYICAKAFEGIRKWTNIIVPDSVTKIEEGAFYNCNVKSITLPFVGSSRDVKDSYDAVFGYIFGSADENTGGTTVQNYKGGSSNYYIPSTLTSVTVTDADTIGYGAFSGCSNLTSITIPSSVTEIGPIAFANCTGLPSFTIPTGIETIENSTFSGCSALTSIVIPANVTSVGNWAFSDCDKLASVTIPDTVTSVGDWAFSGCDVLNNVSWPSGTTRIGGYTFYSCSALNNITIPETVTSIGEYAFYGTQYYNDNTKWENNALYLGNFLVKVNDTVSGEYQIKDGTKYIGDGAFDDCELITSVTIPESVVRIGEQAFYNCDGLTSVTIPDSVTHIDDWAFFGCDDLVGVTFGENVSSIGKYAFANCPVLTGVVLPDSITAIGESAFCYCDGLTSIIIPDSMTDVAYRLFYDCDGLTQATIGRNVKTIGGYTFGDNDNLKTIVIPKSVTNIMTGAFERCKSIRTVNYDGDHGQWEQIDIDILNECIFNISASISLEVVDGVFYVTPFNLRQNNAIVFACYKGGKLVFVETHLYQDTDPERIPFTPNVDYDKVKVMLWDSLGGMSPLGEPKNNASDSAINVNLTSTPSAVTNIDTSELITVTFAETVDMDTVTNTTVYAVAQEDKTCDGTYFVTAGDIYTLNPVKKNSTNNSFAIDISALDSGVSYKIVIDGVMETSGKYINYTSDSFTTGAIANIEYQDGVKIKNLAKEATIAPGVTTSTSHDLASWIDGDYSTWFSFNSKTFSENYAVIDLGKPCDISSIGVQLTGTPWHSAGVGVFVKETLDGISYDTLTSDNGCVRLSGTTNNSPVYAGMMEYIAVDTSKKYQYIIIKDMSVDTDTNYDLVVGDIYVLQPVSSVTATINLTSTPEAVTNIETEEMITVTFSADIDMDTVNDDTVYAVATKDKQSHSKGPVINAGDVYPLNLIKTEGVNDSFLVDVSTLDGLAEYKLVVDGVKTKNGSAVAGEEKPFITGAIAKIPYADGMIIKNLALGKTITASDSGAHQSLSSMTDGNVKTNGVFNDKNSTNYAVLDLGGSYKINSIGAIWAAAVWTNQGAAVCPVKTLSEAASLTQTDFSRFNLASDGYGGSNIMDYAEVDTEDTYQFVVLRDFLSSSNSISMNELYVFAQVSK